MPEHELGRLAESGLLHPRDPSAAQIRAAFETLAGSGADRAALFMALAHLLGGWIPLLRHEGRKLPPGRPLLALAVTEEESGSDLYSIQSSAVKVGGGWRLEGKKVFVTNAPVASHILLLARTERPATTRALSCFLLPRDTPGLSVRPMPPLMGLSGVRIGEVQLSGALVAEEAMIGAPGEGAHFFRTAMSWERSLILCHAPGTIERLLEQVLKDASLKRRMGTPLTEQALFRQKVSQVRAAIGELRLAVEGAAEVLDSGKIAVRSAMAAKLRASRLYEEASRNLLQLGGARAYLSGSELEGNFRDSLASSLYSGPNELLELALGRSG